MGNDNKIIVEDINLYCPKDYSLRKLLYRICALLNTGYGGAIRVGYNKYGEYVESDWFNPSKLEELIYEEIYPNPNGLVRILRQSFSQWGSDWSYFIIEVKRGDGLFFIKPLGKYFIANNADAVGYLDAEIVQKLSDYSRSGLPKITKHQPSSSDAEQFREFKKTQDDNNVDMYKFGKLNPSHSIYKYMDLETFLHALKHDTLRFDEPSKWADKYESRFYNANYSLIHPNPNDVPFLYACCLSNSGEDEAAWKLYSYQKTGIGAHCVEIKINKKEFRNQLIHHLKNCTVYVGEVNYQSTGYINSLHAPNIKTDKGKEVNTDYPKYFENFNIYNYLNLLLLKRNAFLHEQEVRYFIVPKDEIHKKSRYLKNGKFKKESEPKDVIINWLEVIEGIQIDSNCSEIEKELLTDRINAVIEGRTNLSRVKKDELKSKLQPRSFDVYGKIETVEIGKDYTVK